MPKLAVAFLMMVLLGGGLFLLDAIELVDPLHPDGGDILAFIHGGVNDPPDGTGIYAFTNGGLNDPPVGA
ncbi:hypothetical protein [Brevibacillus migulae]|uniref:hypothetical protein n=1 Tax=Brevibacillus migulae TaxID=1644114 RepID=UPI00106E4A99|nr:hypothetical protein [Brevibacillus migulae]